MEPSQSKIIILKSLKDFSKQKGKLNYSLELEQIRKMFTNNVQLPYIQKSISTKTEKSEQSSTMRKNQLKRYEEVIKSVDYKELQIGLLGTKSKSLNMKTSQFQRTGKKKEKKKKKLSEDKSSLEIKNKYLRLEPISKKQNVSSLMKKMQNILKREQQESVRNVRRVITQVNSFHVDLNKSRKQQLIFEPINVEYEKSVHKIKIGLRKELIGRNSIEEKKRFDKVLSEMNKNQKMQKAPIQKQKRSTDHLGPWHIQNEQHQQI